MAQVLFEPATRANRPARTKSCDGTIGPNHRPWITTDGTDQIAALERIDTVFQQRGISP